MNRFITFIVILAVAFMACSCTQSQPEGKIRLVVTKDFGKTGVYDEYIDISSDMSVMDILRENLEIETVYSGGFVDSINGIKSTFRDAGSDGKKDWFFYVNGFMAQVGADDYFPSGGDSIFWDYHRWSEKSYSNQIIGSFPQCFTNGYDGQEYPLEIIYSKDFENEARGIADEHFADMDSVEIFELGEKPVSGREANSLLIGYYDDFSKAGIISDIDGDEIARGAFAGFSGGQIAVCDTRMNVSAFYKSGCTVVFIQKEYPYASGIFAVLGNEESDIRKAVKILGEGGFAGKAAAAVSGGKVIYAPVNGER